MWDIYPISIKLLKRVPLPHTLLAGGSLAVLHPENDPKSGLFLSLSDRFCHGNPQIGGPLTPILLHAIFSWRFHTVPMLIIDPGNLVILRHCDLPAATSVSQGVATDDGGSNLAQNRLLIASNAVARIVSDADFFQLCCRIQGQVNAVSLVLIYIPDF